MVFSGIGDAVRRSRWPIYWVGLTYFLGVAVGAWMVHAHNDFALNYRDRVVGNAQADVTLKSLDRGLPVRAALWDFAENLGRGAVPSTVMGLGIVMPFPLVAFRGWIGGIVSVGGDHKSRLSDWKEGFYYCGVVLLQLIPYTLAGGAGVRLGLANLFPKGKWGYPASRRWLGIPVEGMRDVGRIYVLVVPLFLLASLVEFLFA